MTTYNVLDIVEPRINNYNYQTIRLLKLLECHRPSTDSSSVVLHTRFLAHRLKDYIVSKGTYYCNIVLIENSSERRIDFPWLVMIGSDLDFVIRHFGMSYVTRQALESSQMMATKARFEHQMPQDLLSKLYTCFIISGCLKQLPVYITNNRLNYHIVKSKGVVRKFIYNNYRGTQVEFNPTTDTLCLTSSKNIQTKLENVSNHVLCSTDDGCFAITSELQRLFGTHSPNQHSIYKYLQPLHKLMIFYSAKKLNIDHLGKIKL